MLLNGPQTAGVAMSRAGRPKTEEARMSTMYNSDDYFRRPLVAETGFREYDARWIIEPIVKNQVSINYLGLRIVGKSLARLLRDELGSGNEILVGHDFRKYSENAKNALVVGLLEAGMSVVDIGLTTTSGAYFAQFDLDVSCVAMVTASHNCNGWTGIKAGNGFASTFGSEEMDRFRRKTREELNSDSYGKIANSGVYRYVSDIRAKYIDDLVNAWIRRFENLPRLRVAVDTGNGTAGLYVPELLKRLGFEIVEGNVTLDWDFPHYNPDPESIPFLTAVANLVRSSGADIGLCMDGDGDRLGVVDDRGKLIFADKVGLLIAKHLSAVYGTERPIVVDIKSTSLFETELRAPIIWTKTGHSYVKAKVRDSAALAGFERSGHFFFPPPLGRGYDDACVAALALLWAVCSERQTHPSVQISTILARLPMSFSSPNRQPPVPDDQKYRVVDQLSKALVGRAHFVGKKIVKTDLLNGIRITLEDRSWLLIRASSNTPSLVIIAEAFDADGALLEQIDTALRELISELGIEIGVFEPLHKF